MNNIFIVYKINKCTLCNFEYSFCQVPYILYEILVKVLLYVLVKIYFIILNMWSILQQLEQGCRVFFIYGHQMQLCSSS